MGMGAVGGAPDTGAHHGASGGQHGAAPLGPVVTTLLALGELGLYSGICLVVQLALSYPRLLRCCPSACGRFEAACKGTARAALSWAYGKALRLRACCCLDRRHGSYKRLPASESTASAA